MDLNQLRYAVALAEEASFSRAAVRLGIAQPSLSQQIKRLEAELGRPLFDRLPRRVVPSHAGEQLLQHARRILWQVADAQRQLGEADGAVAGPVAIGAIPTIAPFVLPPVLVELSRRYPAVEPRVVEDVTDRLIDMLEQGDLDAAILSTHEGSRTVHVERIGQEPLMVMLSPNHRLARRKAVSWRQLRDERFLVLHDMHCLAGQVAQVCRGRDLRPPIVMRGAQLATIAGMVRAGMGISIVPEMMRRAERSNGDDQDPAVRYLPFSDDPPQREIVVAWSLLRYRTHASRAVVELIREHIRGTNRPRRRHSTGQGPSNADATGL